MNPANAPDFDAKYAGTPPWDIGRPQPAIARLAEEGAIRGRVLDVGCGTGEHALMAAALGLEAWGIDTSQRAITSARDKASSRGLKAEFRVWNALELEALDEQFDTVIDSGLFHVFEDDERERYAQSLRAAMASGGRYVMLCFSDSVPGGFGPRRISVEEIRSSFAGDWKIESIEPALMEVTFTPTGISAWLSIIGRSSD